MVEVILGFPGLGHKKPCTSGCAPGSPWTLSCLVKKSLTQGFYGVRSPSPGEGDS